MGPSEGNKRPLLGNLSNSLAAKHDLIVNRKTPLTANFPPTDLLLMKEILPV